MRTIHSEFNRQGITMQKNTTSSVKQLKKIEQLSKWEIEELMGMRRDTFKKKNGAFRQR